MVVGGLGMHCCSLVRSARKPPLCSKKACCLSHETSWIVFLIAAFDLTLTHSSSAWSAYIGLVTIYCR